MTASLAGKTPSRFKRNSMKRCHWVTDDPFYLNYHDLEWGVPINDDRSLFEMLILEGAQAGLSWITILKRRESYQRAYDAFDPVKIADWDSKKVHSLLQNEGIIRNRLKIQSAIVNARAYLDIIEEYGSFADFMWGFVDGRPVQNCWHEQEQIPAATSASTRMSRELKRKGFTFVGPTICYAFMQAVGMVNDHVTGCFRYDQVKNMSIRT